MVNGVLPNLVVYPMTIQLWGQVPPRVQRHGSVPTGERPPVLFEETLFGVDLLSIGLLRSGFLAPGALYWEMLGGSPEISAFTG